MSLESLLAEAMALKKTPKGPRKKRNPRDVGGDAYYRTKEELRQMKLDACVPLSVHLRVTRQVCECGATMDSVNNYPLIRKVSPSLDHFEAVKSQDPGDLSKYNHLPRFLEVRTVDVPWCEDCFSNANYVEVKDD